MAQRDDAAEEKRETELRENVGLCAFCRHVRVVVSDRGSTFYQCRLAAKDERFAKFPRLPVRACPGYEGLHQLFDAPA